MSSDRTVLRQARSNKGLLMNGWSHGYDVSLGYTYNFQREMAPNWIDFCVGTHGYEPERRGSDYRYLDLGCGQGFGLCLLAAANPDAEFTGVDFQAEHIAHGQALAEAADLANVRFIQAHFVELAREWPDELGEFDYVGLHGILSWISPDLRATVMQCLAHATRQGSLVYFGYNTQPGSLSAMPFQHVSRLIKKKAECTSTEALDRSMKLFQQLKYAKAPIFEVLPGLTRRVEGLASLPISYLVHEYLHEHWTPLWHSQVATDARRAGLSYVGTATVAQALLPDAIAPAIRALILQQADADLRQDLQDLVLNQSFRRDIFHCGTPRNSRDTQLDLNARLHLLSPPPQGSSVLFKSTFGDITVDHAMIADIIGAFGWSDRGLQADGSSQSGPARHAAHPAADAAVRHLDSRRASAGAGRESGAIQRSGCPCGKQGRALQPCGGSRLRIGCAG